jgi:hypothetical protein
MHRQRPNRVDFAEELDIALAQLADVVEADVGSTPVAEAARMLDVASSEDGRRVDGVPAWSGRPGPARGGAGHLRCPPGPGRRHRRDAARCQLAALPAHYAQNLLVKVPKSAQPWVATMLRTVFDQPDAEAVRAQFDRVVAAIATKYPDAAEHLADAREDLLAFAVFPREVWKQIRSNNPQERLNKEIRRRTNVVGIFPNRDAIIRLVGVVLAEQTDEWSEQSRYMGPEILANARKAAVNTQHTNPEMPQ